MQDKSQQQGQPEQRDSLGNIITPGSPGWVDSSGQGGTDAPLGNTGQVGGSGALSQDKRDRT